MGRLMIWIGVGAAAWWLFNRLWPAIRTEPETWLGPDWREKLPV